MTVVERERVEEVVTEQERRARILEAAALEIEVRGWGRGEKSVRWWQGGPTCLVGGILAVLGLESQPPGYSAAEGAWGWTDLDSGLWEFNDAAGRTAEEVTFVLRWRAEEVRCGR